MNPNWICPLTLAAVTVLAGLLVYWMVRDAEDDPFEDTTYERFP